MAVHKVSLEETVDAINSLLEAHLDTLSPAERAKKHKAFLAFDPKVARPNNYRTPAGQLATWED